MDVLGDLRGGQRQEGQVQHAENPTAEISREHAQQRIGIPQVVEGEVVFDRSALAGKLQVNGLVGGERTNFHGGGVRGNFQVQLAPLAFGGELDPRVKAHPVGEIAETGVSVQMDRVTGAGDNAFGRRPVLVQLGHFRLHAGGKFAKARTLAVLKNVHGGSVRRGQNFPPDQIHRHGHAAVARTVFHVPQADIHRDPECGDE